LYKEIERGIWAGYAYCVRAYWKSVREEGEEKQVARMLGSYITISEFNKKVNKEFNKGIYKEI